MRLSEKEFWGLTLAQFNALAKEYASEQEWQNHRAALICAVIANANRDPKKHKAFQPKDFMPKKEEKKERKELTGEQMLDRLKMVTAAFGGEVKER